MTTYVQELQNEIERVTLKGNADKQTIRRLASIIFRMDQRIIALEGKTTEQVEAEVAEASKPKAEEAPAPKKPAVKPAKASEAVEEAKEG